MGKRVFMAMVLGTLVVAGAGRSAFGELVNPSFEADGVIEDITVAPPTGWEVDMPPTGDFGGYVDETWATDANHSLTIYNEFGVFGPGDMGAVCQPVMFADVNRVTFDVNLATYFGDPWDPTYFSAVVLIDGDVVWESKSVGSDIRGEYRDQFFEVDPVYDTPDARRLSLGLRANGVIYVVDNYLASWDNIRLTIGCGGAGYLAGDMNNDCVVDVNDLRVLGGMWLEKVEYNGGYDIAGDEYYYPYGFVDFLDFAVFAAGWRGDYLGLRDIAESWLQQVDRTNPANYYRPGIINFRDYAVLANDWLRSSYE
jgi:hypothetical protein